MNIKNNHLLTLKFAVRILASILCPQGSSIHAQITYPQSVSYNNPGLKPEDKNYKYEGGGDSGVPGSQTIKWSTTGHRGTDIEVSVFNAPKGPGGSTSGGGFADSNYHLNRKEVMKANPQMTKEKLKTIFK